MTSFTILPIRLRRGSDSAVAFYTLHAGRSCIKLTRFQGCCNQIELEKTAVNIVMADTFKALLGETLVGTGKGIEAVCGEGKTVGIYFSAHWCPPCRGFTPKLAEFYKKYHTEKNFEIVFVSSDKNEGEFQEYYKEMPWLALPYSDRDRKVSLLAIELEFNNYSCASTR